MVYPATAQGERRSLYLAGPCNIEKYETIICDVSEMRRYSRNILKWRKTKTKNTNSTQWRLLQQSPAEFQYVVLNVFFDIYFPSFCYLELGKNYDTFYFSSLLKWFE